MATIASNHLFSHTILVGCARFERAANGLKDKNGIFYYL